MPPANAQSPPALIADDYLQIRQLVARYAIALDGGGNVGFDYADLFAPGAEFIRPYTTGRDNLAKLALDQPHGPLYVRHFITNHVIESSARGRRSASSTCWSSTSRRHARNPARSSWPGTTRIRYVKSERGWRFKRREFIPSRPGPAAPAAR